MASNVSIPDFDLVRPTTTGAHTLTGSDLSKNLDISPQDKIFRIFLPDAIIVCKYDPSQAMTDQVVHLARDFAEAVGLDIAAANDPAGPEADAGQQADD